MGTRVTVPMGSREWQMITVAEEPMVLRSILVPVGWMPTKVYVGSQFVTLAPATSESAAEQDEHHAAKAYGLKQARAHFVRYRLDTPMQLHPGTRIEVNLVMPVMYAECAK